MGQEEDMGVGRGERRRDGKMEEKRMGESICEEKNKIEKIGEKKDGKLEAKTR